MLLFIHLASIGFMIWLCIHFAMKNYSQDASFFSGAGVVILIGILIGAYTGSYGNYVDLREYKDGLVLQHDLKALNAISKTIKGDDNMIAETKDGYYKGLIDGIYGAKHRINDYNSTIISKKLYGSNFFYGLYVIEPDDDMKVIDVSQYDFKIGE